MPGSIRIGIGGWTFEPWRGVFYPQGLAQKRELEFASRRLTAIEINGTYYSTFKPDSWSKWRDETPDDFVFTVKASRFSTNRRVLAEGGESIEKFLGQGMTLLGPKLGPINWQFMATKQFDAADFGAFLALLPAERDGVRLRHAVEVRHASFDCDAFRALCAEHGVAIVHAEGAEYPTIAPAPVGFTYARLMGSRDEAAGFSDAELDAYAECAKAWSAAGDVFAFFISGTKVRNPAAAEALIGRLDGR